MASVSLSTHKREFAHIPMVVILNSDYNPVYCDRLNLRIMGLR